MLYLLARSCYSVRTGFERQTPYTTWKGVAVILQRVASTTAILTAAGCLAGCGSSSVVDGAPDGYVTDVPIYEVHLSTGPYLNCMATETGLFGWDTALDCDWNSGHPQHNPELRLLGTFQVFQKRNDWDTVFDCIASEQFWGDRVDSCDYAHKRQIHIFIS